MLPRWVFKTEFAQVFANALLAAVERAEEGQDGAHPSVILPRARATDAPLSGPATTSLR